jgi:hypothetical protein
MDAIEVEKREVHIANAKALFANVSHIRELDNGYAFCLGNEAVVLQSLVEFISLEKLFCPFIGFTIRIEPEGGDIWLELVGREGVKPFIQAEIGEIIGRPIPLVTSRN